MPTITENFGWPIPDGADDADAVATVGALGNAVDVTLAQRLPAVYEGVSTGQITLTGSVQDVPGTTVSFTVTGLNAYIHVQAVFDFNNTVTTASNVAIGRVHIDGLNPNKGEAHCDDHVSRMTCPLVYKLAVAPGAHTAKMVGVRAGTGGTFALQTIHTAYTVTVYDQ